MASYQVVTFETVNIKTNVLALYNVNYGLLPGVIEKKYLNI